jgi:hypothetical protein
MKTSDRGSARTANRDDGTSCHGTMRTLPPIGFRNWRCREGSITAPTGLRAATRSASMKKRREERLTK